MLNDWPIWPLFIIQLFTAILVLLPGKLRVFGSAQRPVVISLLLIIVAAILIILCQHSTDTLKLNF